MCDSHPSTPLLGDVIQLHGNLFLEQYPQPLAHLKILSALKRCRTKDMGYRLEECPACGKTREVECSCRNRHCPTCGQYTRAKWLFKRSEEMLPIRYFHKVFTLPHAFNPLILSNRKILLDHLFQSVSQTLLTFGRNPENQFHGGELGFSLFLHTWNQTLMDHFHLHVIIPGGVLSEDGMEWIGVGKSKYLFRRGNLSTVFRAKFLEGLKNIYDQKLLFFPDSMAHLSDEQEFQKFLNNTLKHDWVVFSKATIQIATHLLEYLSQYTHRVAITNDRILSVNEKTVLFKYKDRRDEDKTKTLELPGVEFLRRFTLHFLPRGFMKVRSYGWMANRYRKQKLAVIRASLRWKESNHSPQTFEEWYKKRLGIDPFLCPYCKQGRMKVLQVHYGHPPKFPNTS